jgi:hypothetical protein
MKKIAKDIETCGNVCDTYSKKGVVGESFLWGGSSKSLLSFNHYDDDFQSGPSR